MGRIVRDYALETREARTKLKPKSEPYWRSVFQGAHIGYYKGSKSATWIARYRHDSDEKGYKKLRLGKADDFQDADGLAVLNFRQAQKAAQKWFHEQSLIGEGHTVTEKDYTVADVIKDYEQWYVAHRKSWSRVRYQIEAHIIPELGKTKITKLTATKIQKWHRDLASQPAKLRSSRFSDSDNFKALNDDEAIRKRKSSSNRTLTILKAALNRAYHDGKIASDGAWKRVKPFRGVDVAKIRYLKEDEIKRLVNAVDPEFRPMVQAGLLTGCRYGELCRLSVADLDSENGTIHIRQSKNGKARNVILTEEGVDFFQGCIIGKYGADSLIMHRKSGEAWGRSHQTRRLKEACKNGKIAPAISFHILRHTYASRLAMQGAPMAVIAHQLGHSDTRIVEKHYAHLSPSYMAETVRNLFPKLNIYKENNVRAIK